MKKIIKYAIAGAAVVGASALVAHSIVSCSKKRKERKRCLCEDCRCEENNCDCVGTEATADDVNDENLFVNFEECDDETIEHINKVLSEELARRKKTV